MTHLDRIQHTVEQVRDTLTVRRVYGEPIERNGTVVIPAADVRGGGGGGGGLDTVGNVGGGSGFGIKARPVGAFVIRSDGDVQWVPVVDNDRKFAMATTVSALTLLALRTLKRRRKRR